ncbi:MAG: M28 family peptidase [Candidatus Helarchaeota archaeon]
MALQDYKIDSDENSDYMYNIIARIIKEAGPRPPCSENERKGIQIVAEDLGKFCDEVRIDSFETYPQLGIVSWARRNAVLLFLAYVLYLLVDFSPIFISILCFALTFLALVNLYFQYLKVQQKPKLLPYKKKTSQNVIGIIKPTGPVKKRVLFGGHIDSAFRFNLLQWTREGYIYFLVGGLAAFFSFPIMYLKTFILAISGTSGTSVLMVFNWLSVIIPIGIGVFFLGCLLLSVKILKPPQRKWIFWGALSRITPLTFILIVGIMIYQIGISSVLFNYVLLAPLPLQGLLLFLNYLPFLIAMFFFLSKKGVPGALDNLSGCAISLCIAKILKDWKTKFPDLVPKNTEVVIVEFGCEEIGVKGSEAFSRKYAPEYNQIDTTCIVLDTISDPELVKIYERESSTSTDFDPEICRLLAKSAEELNINYEISNQPWASGGSDATGLIHGGLRAAPMIGLYYPHYLQYYHTDRDDISIINRQRRPCTDFGDDWNTRNIRCAFENTLKICMKYIQKKDQQNES